MNHEQLNYSSTEVGQSSLKFHYEWDLDEKVRGICERVSFSELFFGHLMLSREKENEQVKIGLAHAGFYDLQQGIQLHYDYDWHEQALHRAFGEDPYKPYRAYIAFAAAEEIPNGRISHPVDYGHFWYDHQGRLRAISAE